MELAPGIRCAVSDRHGGVSPAPYGRNLGGATADDYQNVLRNRELTARQFGLAPDRVVWMRQVHSATVQQVKAPWGSEAPALDGVWTTEPGLALASLGADCAAVLLADPVARVVGAAHSGRVGTLTGVAPNLVAAMAEAGAEPGRMTALIGPAACGHCYEVPAAMREESAAVLPEVWSTTRQGTPALDLRAGITAQLTRAGLTDIRHDARCTIEDQALFSHRREQATGRFAAYIWLQPQA
ncbi:peptidoglycan editing factor PgeF [Kitasatospora sp. NBC_01250]|uniref:peptidoglycan editing factor PgeF n=1 Tax=unclassified Kitasatospora TaxID=2633591 RepID=UPI002E1336D5|nr:MULTISPECIES: peptidoglycan editing factor PgeF [unclassified Kitasatospora]WSJ68683.1 peptidoglycan editing factor PgeF [Kitasatospora sp. NBC_01302]